MSRLFYQVMQDNTGNLLFDVSGTMRIAGSGTLATIYGDEALTVILPNPMTNHPSFGSFKCFLGAGDFDFYMAKSGYTFETLTGVQGHGTMAQQDANAVAITGGSATGLSQVSTTSGGFTANNPPAGANVGLRSQVSAGTGRYNLYCEGGAPSVISGQLALGGISPEIYTPLHVFYPKAYTHGLMLRPNDNDTGPGRAVILHNLVGTEVGSINTTATATSYNTSSDVRLKHAIAPLTGALDVVRSLRPVAHLWKVDDSPGVGFLAHEVQQVVGGAVTGDKDAVDEDGRILAQQMDYSKLVPWLVGAVKELTQQVELLQAQLAEAGA